MKKISVVCAGKLKEQYWREACGEYVKRLSAYCDLRVIEVADERTRENASAKETEAILEKEGARLLRHIDADAYCIALAINGRKTDSVSFATHMQRLRENGDGKIVFVIGSSLGLSAQVLARANEKLSFSDLTFPHQMARVILLEQLYRGYRIINGEPYHK